MVSLRPWSVVVAFAMAALAIAALAHPRTEPAGHASLKGNWVFTATIDTPSTTIDGKMHIVLDSAGLLVGAVKIDQHVIPFHGRRIADRLVARSDTAFRPKLTFDCSCDSLGSRITGKLKVSKIRAVDHRHQVVEYDDLVYEFYGLRE